MTNEQINAAIDRITGCDQNDCRCDSCHPDWVNSLDAMHKAEAMLTKGQVREYQTYMYDMAYEIENTCGRWMPYSATAAYRAEAFLRTLGKWEEAQ